MQNSTKIQWIVRDADKYNTIVNCLKTQAYSLLIKYEINRCKTMPMIPKYNAQRDQFRCDH